MKKFFVGCNIHFEDELEKELAEIWPYLIELDGRPHSSPLTILEKIPGGILLEAPFHIGLQINFFSKLANRVLLRIKEFRAREFPKMVHTFRELKKDSFLKDLSFSFQVSARESRLNNEKRIQSILEEVFGAEEKQSHQTLYVRMEQDLCTVSLDTTGVHLHKRTERVEHGEAPLRETLAAFCARKLVGNLSAAELSCITLIDPMCGTGSLLREARSLYQPVFREGLSFLSWPQTPKILKSSLLMGNYPAFPLLFKNVEGADRDSKSVQRAETSLQVFGAQASVRTQDLFQATPVESRAQRWILSNPPYGERLKADFDICQLLRQLDKVYQPQKLALLLGEAQSRQVSEVADFPLQIENKWKFKNGGLPVQLFLFSSSRQDWRSSLDKNEESE